MVSFENFVKSMTPSLLELKVTPSFCFAFKIPDNVTATNTYTYWGLMSLICMISRFEFKAFLKMYALVFNYKWASVIVIYEGETLADLNN